MKSFLQQLDRAGFNPRLMSLVALWAGSLGYFVVCPLLQAHTVLGIVEHGGVIEVDLKTMGSIRFDEVVGTIEDVPKVYRQLDGKKVSLEGFILSRDPHDKISSFQLVYNIQERWPQQVQQRVFVTAAKGISVDQYYQLEVRIIGTLHIKIERDPDADKVIRVFSMDLDRIDQL